MRVEGWDRPAYLHRDARPAAPGRAPGRCSARSTRWSGSGSAPSGCSTSTTGSRSTSPRRKRVHGYYVLPFLLGDRIVGRVDLKADRRGRRCCWCTAAYAEPGAPAETAEELAAELADSPAGSASTRSTYSRGVTWRPRWPPRWRRVTAPEDLASDPVTMRVGVTPCRDAVEALPVPRESRRTGPEPGVHARACHPRQAPPHRRGQDPAPAGGDLPSGQRHRGRLRRDERRGAAGADRRVQGSGSPRARPSTT